MIAFLLGLGIGIVVVLAALLVVVWAYLEAAKGGDREIAG